MPRPPLVFAFLLLTVGLSLQTWADDAPRARAHARLDELDAWLGDGDNGDRWRQYLQTHRVRTELDKPTADVDLATVTAALRRYRSDEAGLQQPRFIETRDALSDWFLTVSTRRGGDLAQLALAARGDHQTVSAEELAAARQRLTSAAHKLERALAVDPSRAENWRQYLHWDLLEPHFDADYRFARDSIDNITKVLQRFRSNYPGLELPVFTSTARALDDYRVALQWAATAEMRDAGSLYDALLKNLSGQLDRHVRRPTAETQWRVASIVGILDDLGDSPELVQAVYAHSKQPNLFTRASGQIVNRASQQPVFNSQGVRDCILGTSIFGCANTTGTVTLQPIPARDHIALKAVFVGCTASRTVGYHKPVKIHATGATHFVATKHLLFSHEQFMVKPTVAHATTHSHIHSIKKTGGRFGHRLIERIARRKASESKGASEYVAARHAEVKVENGFDDQVVQAVANGRGRYEQAALAPLVRRDVVPDDLLMHSDSSSLGVDATFASAAQLAASSPPPSLSDNHDIAFRVHESAITNYMPLMLAGVTIRQEDRDQRPQVIGQTPPWLKQLMDKPLPENASTANPLKLAPPGQQQPADADGPNDDVDAQQPFIPWSISLHPVAPVSVSFDDGQASIRIRATALVSDEQEFEDWDFVVRYRLHRDGNQIVLRRAGDIEVFPGRFDPRWDNKMPSGKASFRRTIAKNMNARAQRGESFPAEVTIPALQFPKLGTLVLDVVRADDGWLTVAWSLP